MPRRRWRFKDRREPLSQAMRRYLELGLGGLHALAKASRPEGYESVYFSHESDRAAGWQGFGAEITAAWAAGHAGSRPWGWWQFVAPEPRTCLEGAAYVYRGAKPGDGDWIWKEEFGLPGRPQARRPGAKPERLVFESQAAYLRRLDLLIPGEAERIPAEALEPEIVEIPELPALEPATPALPAPALASTNGAPRRPAA
jgi:hypothetical protein